MNDENIGFYEKIDKINFEKLAQMTGFDTGADIEFLFPFIENANTLVEIGAGYGRAIHFLKKKGFKGKIYALERVKQLVERLQKRFDNSVEVIHQDVKKIDLNFKPDVFIWLWSGIMELSREEQIQTIGLLGKNLEKGGLLLIETPDKILKFVGEKKDKERFFKLETTWGKLEAYLPDIEEINEYAQINGFSSCTVERYQSAVGLKRLAYFLVK